MNLFYTRPDRSLDLGVFPNPECVRIAIDDAPRFLQGKRMLYFSDVHLRRSVKDERLSVFIERLAAVKPDMVLMGGDYAEGSDQCLRFFAAFKGVSCPLGCYAVPGNNDFASRTTLKETMADAGVVLLRNDVQRIELPGGTVEIGGCDDHKYGSPDTAGLFSGDADYRILLSHYPVKPDCVCELMLAGHTHAGQCNVLGITPYSIGFEGRYRLLGVRGFKPLGKMRLLIGNGIGVSRFPFRLGARPQIYCIDFS